MDSMIDFGTIITPMITPFDERFALDLSKTSEMMERLISLGTDSIIVGGMTGESETLTREEKLQLLNHTINISKNRIQVIASVGMETKEENIRFLEEIDELDLANGFLIHIPYHVGMNQEAIYQYVLEITQKTKLPVLLYNGPIKAGVYIEPETVIRLASIPQVWGIQESSEDIPSITKIISGTFTNFHVYAGDDRFALPILSIGGRGVVSVGMHVWGEKVKNMITLYQRGQMSRATAYHQELSMYSSEFFERTPSFIKNILKVRGIDMGNIRNVYVEMEEEDEMFAKLVFGRS